MNYTELVSAIKSYAENDFPATSGYGDFTSAQQLETFIRQAEQRVYNTVQTLAARKVATLTTVSSNPMLVLPTDWLFTYSTAVLDPVSGEYEFLLNKDVSFIRSAYPATASTGRPAYYAYFSEASYILGPTPNAAYSVWLEYAGYPESIVDAGTTWLGDNFDSVLLFGALLEADTFMKGEQDVESKYQKRYDTAIALLKELAEGKNRQDMYRTAQPRYPVK